MIPLSVLEVCPVWRGGDPAESLRSAVDLARGVEAFGYRRFWVAEHHGTASLATAAPGVLVAAVAGATTTLRVGSGGVLLPNHPPLVIAEQFGTLEALHPGRIDLGVGRAPGGDPEVTARLRGDRHSRPFVDELHELLRHFAPDGDGRALAVPAAGNRPPIIVLGASPDSGALAGALGLPYAFAHHIAPDAASASIGAYRAAFRSGVDDAPHAILAARVVVADDVETARALALPAVVGQLLVRLTGRTDPFPLAADMPALDELAPSARGFVASQLANQLVGDQPSVAAAATDLVEATGADELMALTIVHDPRARLRSYELLAEGLRPGVGPGHPAGLTTARH